MKVAANGQGKPACPICGHSEHTARLSCEVKEPRGECICRGPIEGRVPR